MFNQKFVNKGQILVRTLHRLIKNQSDKRILDLRQQYPRLKPHPILLQRREHYHLLSRPAISMERPKTLKSQLSKCLRQDPRKIRIHQTKDLDLKVPSQALVFCLLAWWHHQLSTMPKDLFKEHQVCMIITRLLVKIRPINLESGKEDLLSREMLQPDLQDRVLNRNYLMKTIPC